MSERTFLVTGALGCIGAWTLYHLVQQGERTVSFDIAEGGHRVDQLMKPEEKAAVTFVRGDLTNTQQVLDVCKTHHITHIIHLAALQVPFCRANPPMGAQVNVVGTVNIFEAARQTGINHLAYASSISVYGPPDMYPAGPIAHDAPLAPTNLYGVYKQADEGLARIYWQDYKIGSTALRPYTVYGLGRDQGLTSDPTKAMLAAVAGQPFTINFSNKMQFQFASDVARQFIEAAITPSEGAFMYNLGGDIADSDEMIALIRQTKPNAQITHSDTKLPFPDSFDDTELKRRFAHVYETPLADGVAHTMGHFEACLADGRITFKTA